MNQINAIINEVKKALASKLKEIEIIGDGMITFVKEDFKNRQMEVIAFEANIRKKAKEPCIKTELITKCKNDAQELIIAINKIKVA
ncbi:hypothetical protein [Mucilaginibacter sp. FT3.2]|uniref:hypothetical protein n=1 Tax=Mucilaginibacter sp. FT3.2 TaxID=2723090 RepID=UPI001615E20B|nr:hypothetical protein [Mucilaginibacter sp. FT3.2]MBB6235141.1 hypothetical protein [Mucilaginibacter sp. FT3.2]